MNLNKAAAKAMVAAGSADMWQDLSSTDNDGTHRNGVQVGVPNETYPEIAMIETVDPFADTLEGRRQLDALLEWFKVQTNQYGKNTYGYVWGSISRKVRGTYRENDTRQEAQIACVKACLEVSDE